MESIIKYGGWLIAAALLVFGLNAHWSWQAAEERSFAIHTESMRNSERAQERERETRQELAALQEEAEALRSQVQKLQEQLAANAETPADTPAPEPPGDGAVPEVEGEPESVDEGGPSRGERMADAQMAIMANIAYQDLYNELNLPADVREQLGQMVASHLTRIQRSTMAAFQAQDRPAREVHAEQEAMDAELRAQLEGFLTPEELAAWDEYEPVADQIMYERLVDGQLNMMAAGLTQENRVLASQVVAEELVREFDLFNASDELYTMDNFNGAQARALSISLERLNGAIAAEQYGLVAGYVDQALRMFEAMSEHGG